MRTGRPSQTAAWVATLRGLAWTMRVPIVDDPVARELVPLPYGPILDLANRVPRVASWVHATANKVSLGQADHIAFRTRAIDDAVARAVKDGGARQLVSMGAGLDARAFRLEALRDAVVFEVDHPATQAYKKARVAARAPLARELRFVPVDFARDALEERLAAAGHDAARPTVFVWEGVTMYLHREAIEGTLAAVGRRAAPGSSLLVTYLRDDTRGLGTELLHLAVRIVREPFRTKFAPSALARAVRAHGFELTSDEGDADWAERYLGARGPRRAGGIERLLWATKR